MDRFRIDTDDKYTTPTVTRPRTSLSPIKYNVGYTGLSQQCCVGVVDMSDSTRISSQLPEDQWGKYYEIFLNSISDQLYKFGGFVIKNMGDGILFYFLDSQGSEKDTSFRNSIECSMSMVGMHSKICELLNEEDLPCLNFRVSLDYGKVILMKTSNCVYIDIIGPPVNMCAKINHFAQTNGLVVGGDFYQNVKKFNDFKFTQEQGYKVGNIKFDYPVYSVSRK